MTIEQILDKIYPISIFSKLVIQEIIEEISFPKKHLIISTNKIEKNIYFIKKGIARTFFDMEDKEVTFSFGKEGDTIASLESYIAHKKGYENIELLEDCELYKLNTEHLQALFKKNIEIANWGRKFAEQELIKSERRHIFRHLGTAQERYEELMKTHPELITRVQQTHLASYLGITAVSLSRIRTTIR